MTRGLERYYGSFHLHFITCSCYHRLPHLASPERRDAFLIDLEEVRQRYSFVVLGYVVMPEHFHLLMSEPEFGDPSRVMSALKFRVAKRQLREMREAPGELGPDLVHFWQHRFYDFNVWRDKKRIEKLRYMHRNPVVRGIVASPELWKWSSYRFYLEGEAGPVRINEGWPKADMRVRP